MDTSPVGMAAVIVAVIGAFIGVLVAFGVPIPEGAEDALVAFFVTASPLFVWLLSRGRTTPLADPRDEQGVKLVRETDHQPPLQAQRYQAKKRAA